MKKVKEVNERKIFISEKISFIPKKYIGGSTIYDEFSKKELFNMKESFLCLIKRKDGSYLAGGQDTIFQFSFNENGECNLIAKVNSGYGTYCDDYSGNCIFSNDQPEYFGVGFIQEFENGDILTVSDFMHKRKIWNLKISILNLKLLFFNLMVIIKYVFKFSGYIILTLFNGDWGLY